MRILYFSDKYACNVMGTKRSIFEELERLGHEVFFIKRDFILDILKLISKHNPEQVWLAHSNLLITKSIKNSIKIPIIGFGFSDPYYFKPTRFESYDVYIANHYETFLKYNKILPMFYNPTACDFRFHKTISVKKDIDVSIIGRGIHQRFKNKNERIEIFHKLQKDTNLNIHSYGQKWGNPHPKIFKRIYGDDFLNVINRSKIGIDIQDERSPLAHRMFEYSACGTPVITRRRKEVFKHLEENKEILAYSNYKELKSKIKYYIENEHELIQIGKAAQNRCRKEHDIQYRVTNILSFLKKVFS